MRRAAEFRELAQWVSPPDRIAAIARVETLCVARFETILAEALGLGLLDLTFGDGGRTAVISSIAVETTPLAQREGSVLLWPEHVAAGVPASVLDSIEDAVTPWLRTLVRGRVVAGESIRRYAPSPAFDAARERGDLGAAPFAVSLAGVAPFVYARRFARGKVANVSSAHAARGAAVLRDIARASAVADSAAACDWFGIVPGASTDPIDLAVVERPEDAPAVPSVVVRTTTERLAAPWRNVPIPEPIPVDLAFTFDEADAPAVGWFAARSVDRVERPVRFSVRPPASRESSGRIALWVRADSNVAADADTDEARELAVRLHDIGIDAAVCTSADQVAAYAPDLVHVFAAYADEGWYGSAARLRTIGVPYVVSLEPFAGYTLWEESALAYIGNVIEAGARAQYRASYGRRALVLPDHEASLEAPVAATARAEAEMRELLVGAKAVFTSDDPAAVRARFSLAPEQLVAYPGVLIAPEAAEEDVSALLPSEPFALLAAPVLSRNHQISIVDALRGRVPLVIAGPVSDVIYTARLQRSAASGVTIVADPSPGVFSALLRRASIFVEPSLRPTGIARVARAVLCGAAPMVPIRSPLANIFGAETLTYEPLDTQQTLGAFSSALADPNLSLRAGVIAQRIGALADQTVAFRNVLRAYAQSIPA